MIFELVQRIHPAAHRFPQRRRELVGRDAVEPKALSLPMGRNEPTLQRIASLSVTSRSDFICLTRFR